MATIPTNPKDTAQLIYAAYAAQGALEPGFRQHLGASLIGDACRRKLWYTFRGATKPNHSGRVLRLFRRGQEEELTFADDLRSIGCTLHTVDPETGQQWRVADCGGHFGGSLDGALIGLPVAPDGWHVVEMKTSNENGYKAMVKGGVEKSKPLHYAQMQVYMHLTDMTRAVYLMVNKNDDSIYTERVHYDKAKALALIEKAQTVIDAPEPLERISEDPG